MVPFRPALAAIWLRYAPAFFIAMAAASLLGGYEFIRSPTNTLFKTTYGKENLPWLMALIPFSVMTGVYIYARILSWLGPRKTLLVTSLGSAVLIVLGQLAFDAGFKPAVVFLYQIREIYVVLLIEQYWSFLNSTYAGGEGRRINGPICGIASLGAITAGTFGISFVGDVGTSKMILLAAAFAIPAAFFANHAFKLGGEPKALEHEGATPTGHLALSLFKSEHLLIVIFCIIVLTQVISAVLGLVYEGMLQDKIPDADTQTAYSFNVFRTINIIAAIFQFIVTPILLSVSRLSVVHILVPLVHVAAGIAFLHSPSLSTAAFAYIAFKALDYSIFRAAKEILYVPLSFAARYRAKEVIDVFGYRFSKGGTALIIALIQRMGIVFSESIYAMIGLVAALAWTGLTLPLLRRFRRTGSTEH